MYPCVLGYQFWLFLYFFSSDACTNTTPLVNLADIFDVITINQCEEVFNVVEHKLSVWKSVSVI
jgi:hypothetical protein